MDADETRERLARLRERLARETAGDADLWDYAARELDIALAGSAYGHEDAQLMSDAVQLAPHLLAEMDRLREQRDHARVDDRHARDRVLYLNEVLREIRAEAHATHTPESFRAAVLHHVGRVLKAADR
jgi:hypothetical protein